MARPTLTKHVSKGAKDKPFSHGVNVSQQRWDSIFGKKTGKPEKGTWVWVDGKMVKQEDAYDPSAPSAPAIHDDSLYTKQFDYGAGKHWKDNGGRAGRREWMKRKGVIEA